MNLQKKNLLLISAFCLVIVAGLALPYLSRAADTEGGFVIIPPECLGSQKPGETPCDLNSFVQLFVNLAQLAFKILPYLAMLMMMWAGFNLITAGGNPEKIQQGKKMVVSVVVGVVIVIFLAWAYAGFIVFALTGDVTIFPDTQAFTKEWWGGGEATPHAPNAGCCYVPGYGCTELTQLDCTAKAGQYGSAVPQFLGENNFCSDFKVQCENLTKGCCVPNDPADKICYWPDAKKGCLDLATTHRTPTACSYLGQDCDQNNIKGTGTGDATATGCCVQSNTCGDTTIARCPGGGTFKQGVACKDVSECTTGCCIGKNSCGDGKINCTSGLYRNQTCASMQGAECASGCCVQDPNNNCYNNLTAGYCQLTLGGASNSGIACSSIASCTQGCCTDTCQDGNIDGACEGLTYNAGTTCANAPLCSSGCCIDKSNNSVCINNITKNACGTNNSFLVGQACSDVSLCRTGGCCVISPGTCANLTSGQTEAYCYNQLQGSSYSTATCNSTPGC